MSGFVIVIPARYASTRLPGKPLADIAGKPLVQHVYEQALRANADEVVIATDDERVAHAARNFGAQVAMTKLTHASGTDRLAEVAALRGYADDRIIVNLQGDEPLMPPRVVQQVARNLAQHNDAVAATLCEAIEEASQLSAASAVKVVFDARGYALYFSRAPIPWVRDTFEWGKASPLSSTITHYRHIGLYAYRAGFLAQYSQWQPTPLEQAESLEQLRILYNGFRIHVDIAVAPTPAGVDTPEDLTRVRALLSR